MEKYSLTMLLFAIGFIFSSIWMKIFVFRHEYRHFSTAYNISKSHSNDIHGDIYLFWSLPFDWRIKKGNYVLIFTRKIQSYGRTELSNYYQKYNDDEIIKIAAAGNYQKYSYTDLHRIANSEKEQNKIDRHVTYKYFSCPIIIMFVFAYIVFLLIRNVITFSPVLGTICYSICMAIFKAVSMKQKYHDYNDILIIKNPSGFRDYKKKQCIEKAKHKLAGVEM